MSKLLLLKKSKAKHYRVISNQPFIEVDSEDLLVELKNYRNLKLKKNHQIKLKSPTGRTQRICNSEDLRPSTTEYLTPKINLQEALKLKHSKVLEKYKLNGKSNSRTDLKSFLENFQYFKDLKIEIELNSEISKGKVARTEKAKGLYSLLFDRISGNSFEIKNFEEVFKEIKDFCCVFRDVLRMLNEKGNDEDVLNLELLWRIVLKLIDSSLMLQETTVNQMIEKTDRSLKEMNEKCTKKIADMKISMEEVTKSLRTQIADQKKTIKYLKRQNYGLDDMVKQKEAYIADLLEPESQDKSCEIMRATLKKLNLYIKESENEQLIQVNTLKTLSDVIAIAEEINKKPEASSIEVQTLTSFSDTPLPMCEMKISEHPFQVFYSKGSKEEIKNPELLNLLETCLNQSEGNLPFIQEVLLTLSSEFETKNKLEKAVKELIVTLKSDASHSSRLYLYLLGIEKDFPQFLVNYVLQMNQYILQVVENNTVTLPKLMDFYYSFLDDGSDLFEKVLERLTFSFNNSPEDRLNVLIGRLFLACNRSRTLENTQTAKNIENIRQSLKTSTSWIVSKNDLSYFFDNVNLNQESDLSSLFSSLSSKVFSLKVTKNEVLLGLSLQLLKKMQKVQDLYSNIWTEENIENFVDLVQVHRKDLQGKSIRLAFVQDLLGVNEKEILEKVLEYDFSNSKARNSLLTRKKTLKRGKGKK